MGNYKSSISSKINWGGVITNVPIGAKIVHLHDQVAGSSAADGFIDVFDNAIYQVPAGKTLRILGFRIQNNTPVAADTVVISTGDTENAETATLLTILISMNAQQGIIKEVHVDLTLASAKFLTYSPSSTTVIDIEAIGYEY